MDISYEDLVDSALRANLERHATRSTSTEKGDSVSYTEYQTSEQAILTTYANAPFSLNTATLENVRQRVQDEVFATSRKTVEAQIATLVSDRSTEDDLYHACHLLSYSLFRPWYQQERYYSADYFARKGGIRLLVDLIRSSKCRIEVKLVAMSALWNFCSDERRSRLLIENDILSVLDPLLKLGNFRVRTKCVGLLWGLLEFPDVQKDIVQAGFLTPLSEILNGPLEIIKIIELAIGCLHCCCSNYSLVEKLIEENVDEDIAVCCKELSIMLGDVDDEGRETTMSCYIGYHALASMYLHAETKCWLDEVQWSNPEPQLNLIHKLLEKKMTALTDIDTWLHQNSYKDVRAIEDGHYVWRYMHPFAALLYGPSPVVRRMGAFSMANLMQGPENRRLFLCEEGKSYESLQCSVWCKDKETQWLAREAMKEVYKDGVDPPSLQAICRFCVCDNFDDVGRMSIKMLPRSLQTRVVPFLH